MANAMENFGDVLAIQGHYARAYSLQVAAYEIHSKVLPDSVVTAGNLSTIGRLLEKLDRRNRAIEHYQQSHAMFEQALSPEELGRSDLFAGVCSSMALALGATSKDAEALRYARRALATRRAAAGPGGAAASKHVLTCLNDLAAVPIRLRAVPDAQQTLDRAFAMHKAVAEEPSNGDCFKVIADTFKNLAALRRKTDDIHGALESFLSRARKWLRLLCRRA